MTYQRVLVKDHAKQSIRGKKPRRRALAFLLLCLLFSILAMLPTLIAGFVYLPAHAVPEEDAFFTLAGLTPVYWLCQGLTLLLIPTAVALLCTGGCAYCLDLWRGRGVDSGRFWAGFSQFPRTMALGLMIFFFSFLWATPYVLLLLLVWFLTVLSVSPLTLSPVVIHSPEDLAFLLELARPSPLKIALVCVLAALFFALYINRTLRYSLAFFVLLDRPRATARDCLRESKALMRGRKRKLIVLLLSFIGWSLLVDLINIGVQLLWPILMSFFPASALPGAAFWCLRIMLIFYLIALVAAAILLPLWLMNYVGVSLAGFYDFAQSDQQNRPVPPRSWQVYN